MLHTINYKRKQKNTSLLLISICSLNTLLCAQDSLEKITKRFTLHAHETTVSQYRQKFNAPYTGEHSQTTNDEWATTITSTIYGGLRLWKNGEVVVNPEIAGGAGLSSAFGIAAFTNGEAFRVGSPKPTIYLARAYYRQIFALSKTREWQEDGENKLANYLPEKYVSITAGKVSIADYFDDNSFSHNPRTQFMSWGLMSNGAWDYPANTRGYTPSIILEYVNTQWEVRYGISMMPETANGNTMDKNISKANASTFEVKYKYKLSGKSGKISCLAFYNTAFMGSYSASNIMYEPDSANPAILKPRYAISASRQYGRSKYGFGINLEQNLSDNAGLFARASYNDGKNETWCFTEIDRAASLGISIKGTSWKRRNDVIGAAYCISGLSPGHKNYLANGGLGFIIGDGKLNYSVEHLVETYYNAALIPEKIDASFAYQFIANPAYNKDRGPLHIYTIRLHFSI